MMNVFIVVVGKGGSAATTMHLCSDEAAVLKFLGSVPENANDPRVIHRVFAVYESGAVVHYTIVFRGRLMLEEVPGYG